jgi:hypothetical protein
MEKYIINDIKIIHPSIIWVFFGIFLSICLSFAEIEFIKYLIVIIALFLLCSIPYIFTFFTYKKIKLKNDKIIISNAFFELKSFFINDVKNLKILVLNNFPIVSGAVVHGMSRGTRIHSLYGKTENVNILMLMIYNKDDKIVYKQNFKNSKYLEKIINEKIGYNYSGVIEFLLYFGSIQVNNTYIFRGNEEANKYWMEIN